MALNNLVILMLTTLYAIPPWKKRGAFEFFTLAEWIVIQLSFLKPWVVYLRTTDSTINIWFLSSLKNNTDVDSSTHGS